MNKNIIKRTYTHTGGTIWIMTGGGKTQTVTSDRFLVADKTNRRALMDSRYVHAYINSYQYWTLS